MGVRFPSVQSNTLLAANSGVNVEQAMLTTPPLTTPLDSAVVLILFYLVHVIGTTSAGYQVRIRRGSGITGLTINGVATTAGTAGNSVSYSGFYFDTPGAVAGQQYTLTLIDVGSTVGGAIQDGAMLAFAL